MMERSAMSQLNCCANNKSENDGKFLARSSKIETKDEIHFVN